MAELKLNAREWNALSADDQAKIETILRKTSVLTDADTLIADPAAPSFMTTTSAQEEAEGFFCKAACSIAEAGAVAACAALSGPAAAVCAAAAHAAGDFCRSKCYKLPSSHTKGQPPNIHSEETSHDLVRTFHPKRD